MVQDEELTVAFFDGKKKAFRYDQLLKLAPGAAVINRMVTNPDTLDEVDRRIMLKVLQLQNDGYYSQAFALSQTCSEARYYCTEFCST